MSQSFRTQPVNIIARKKIKRYLSGEIVFPRIVSQKPRLGDIYPVEKKLIGSILRKVPIEYLYGLKKIALRSRKNDRIGYPYGFYRPSERMIVLYSVPSDTWVLDGFSAQWRKAFRMWGAKIDKRGDTLICEFPPDKLRYLFIAVFCHELGHHYTFQYGYKNKLISNETTNENLADLHGSRILASIGPDLGGVVGSMEKKI